MKSRKTSSLIVLVVLICTVSIAVAQEAEAQSSGEPTKLAVLWISGDPDVALKTCFMYTHAAQHYGWFAEVRLIVWGPSAKLLSENEAVQTKLKAMQESGVVVEACVACADSYGVSDTLRAMGIDVKGMGTVLSGYLKSPEWTVLSY